jgi:hypothetical protein
VFKHSIRISVVRMLKNRVRISVIKSVTGWKKAL